MFYFKSENAVSNADFMRKNFNTEKIEIGYDDRTVYCTAKSVNKGQAVRRLREKYNLEYIIAAGDIEFDISMLEEASAALTHEKIIDDIKKKGSIFLKAK